MVAVGFRRSLAALGASPMGLASTGLPPEGVADDNLHFAICWCIGAAGWQRRGSRCAAVVAVGFRRSLPALGASPIMLAATGLLAEGVANGNLHFVICWRVGAAGWQCSGSPCVAVVAVGFSRSLPAHGTSAIALAATGSPPEGVAHSNLHFAICCCGQETSNLQGYM